MIDVAYFLSDESRMDDWELRYSLRGWEKFFRPLGRIWILGEHKPEWLNEERVTRIAQPDCYRRNKDANLIAKLVRVSMEPVLTERFVSCCDDHVVLKPLELGTLKSYYTGDLEGQTDWKNGYWHKRMRNTRDTLRDRGFPQRDYEGHIPYILEKSKIRTYLNFDYGRSPGYGVYTLYFNTVDAPDIQHISDERIRAGFWGATSRETTINKLEKNQFLAYGNAGFSDTIKRWVEEHLPEPSKYEL